MHLDKVDDNRRAWQPLELIPSAGAYCVGHAGYTSEVLPAFSSQHTRTYEATLHLGSLAAMASHWWTVVYVQALLVCGSLNTITMKILDRSWLRVSSI